MAEELPATTEDEADGTESLSSLADFVGQLVEPVVWAEGIGRNEAVYATEIAIDLPVELELRDSAGALAVGIAPPTQWIETTIMPVWHRMRLRVKVDDGDYRLGSMES